MSADGHAQHRQPSQHVGDDALGGMIEVSSKPGLGAHVNPDVLGPLGGGRELVGLVAAAGMLAGLCLLPKSREIHHLFLDAFNSGSLDGLA